MKKHLWILGFLMVACGDDRTALDLNLDNEETAPIDELFGDWNLISRTPDLEACGFTLPGLGQVTLSSETDKNLSGASNCSLSFIDKSDEGDHFKSSCYAEGDQAYITVSNSWTAYDCRVFVTHWIYLEYRSPTATQDAYLTGKYHTDFRFSGDCNRDYKACTSEDFLFGDVLPPTPPRKGLKESCENDFQCAEGLYCTAQGEYRTNGQCRVACDMNDASSCGENEVCIGYCYSTDEVKTVADMYQRTRDYQQKILPLFSEIR